MSSNIYAYGFQSSHVGSSVSAGRNVYIESTDRDILVEGSLIKAGNNVTLKAARDLVVLAGTDKSQTTADRSSSGFSIGGSVAVGSGGLKEPLIYSFPKIMDNSST